MGKAFGMVVAFCVGLGALYGAQRVFLSAVTSQIASQSQTSVLPQTKFEPTMRIDPEQLRAAINPQLGNIDTTTGQRLAIEGAARRIDQMNRAAAAAVPLPPPRVPGIRY
jgi:hypothetical protein